MRRERQSSTRRPVSIPRVSDPARSSEKRVPTKWSWHFRALQRLRDHLLDDLSLRLAAASEPGEPRIVNQADSATDESDRVLAVSLLSGERDALHEVEMAMQRILNGNYGICEKSGRCIANERLRAIPWTRFSKEAQDEIEKRERLRRAIAS